MSIVASRGIIRPRKRVIAIDVDEVMCPFLHSLMEWRQFTPISKKYPYNYSKIMGISERETRKIMQEFYTTEDFAFMQPIAGAQAGAAYMKAYSYKLYAVTSRPPNLRIKTETWLDAYFPYIFDDLVMTNSYTPNEVSKSTVCKALNVGMIIDDDLATCMECESDHIRGVNFVGDPIYPWCEKNELSVQCWGDIIYSKSS